MTTLLHIKTSVMGENSQSAALAENYIGQWKEAHPEGEVIVRDLVNEEVPHLSPAHTGAFFTPEEHRSDDQKALVAYSDKLIEEVRNADEIVMGMPLYNFGVPSQMKAWFDQLARAGVTFRYTETGPIGLLENKPIRIFATRGGMLKDSGDDHQAPFVAQFLRFIGLEDIRFFYAEGLSMGDDIKSRALQQVNEEASSTLVAA